MDGHIDVSVNKKKTIEQNIEQLHSELMDRNIANHRIIAKFAYRRPLCLRKPVGKRPLKPIKRPNPPQTPVQPTLATKKKGKKVLLPAVRAASAKISRKELKDPKKQVSQMLDLESRPFKLKRCI